MFLFLDGTGKQCTVSCLRSLRFPIPRMAFELSVTVAKGMIDVHLFDGKVDRSKTFDLPWRPHLVAASTEISQVILVRDQRFNLRCVTVFTVVEHFVPAWAARLPRLHRFWKPITTPAVELRRKQDGKMRVSQRRITSLEAWLEKNKLSLCPAA